MNVSCPHRPYGCVSSNRPTISAWGKVLNNITNKDLNDDTLMMVG